MFRSEIGDIWVILVESFSLASRHEFGKWQMNEYGLGLKAKTYGLGLPFQGMSLALALYPVAL